jgi:hypothetical protein
MSFKASLIKTAIKLTPNKMIVWVANFILKDIAELTDFNFDLETRELYLQVQLLGEAETIEVWLEDFAIVSEGESHQFILHQAKSNRLWLHNLLARIAGKNWKIPAIPQLASHMELITELLKAKVPEQPEQEEMIE